MNPEKENLQKFQKIATETNSEIRKEQAEKGVWKTNDPAVYNTPKEKRGGYNDKTRSLKVRIIDCVKISIKDTSCVGEKE